MPWSPGQSPSLTPKSPGLQAADPRIQSSLVSSYAPASLIRAIGGVGGNLLFP